jgi:hypothetical protein
MGADISYVESLEDDGFKRALVFLRRAFSSFGPSEKRKSVKY